MTEPNKPEDSPPGAGQKGGKRPDDDARDDAASTESETGEETSRTDDDTGEAEAKPDELAAEEPAVIGEPDAPDARPDARPDDEITTEESEAGRAGDASDEADRPLEAEDARAEAAEAQPGLRAVSHDPRTEGQEAGEAPGIAGEAVLASEDDARPGEAPETATPEPETVAPTTAAAEPPIGEKVVVERRGGVIPGFLGGAIAVVGAAFAAPYVLPDGMRPVMSLEPVEARLAEQSNEMETMAGRLDEAIGALEGGPSQADLSALSERVAALESDLSGRLDDLASQLAALQTSDDELATRIEEAERAPLEDATDPAVVAALESYGSEVEALRAEVQSQTEENQRLIEEAAAATAEARAAAEAEALAGRQQALVDVRAALDAGHPFAEPLAELSDMEIPAALTDVADDGVPTLAALQADFAGAAREALDAARRADAGDDPGDRALTFLQSQLGVRSLEPREGDSSDAILSRAQAAAQNGDLSAAVEELQDLPEPALAEMQGWIDRARTRAEATDAADQLAASLATN